MIARWTPEQGRAIYDAQVAGRPISDIAHEYGVSRNAVLGVAHRHRKRHGLPVVHPERATRGGEPTPPTPPAPKAPAARVAVPKTARAVAAVLPPQVLPVPQRRIVVTPARNVDRRPRCESVLSDGKPCGRAVFRDACCLGHLFLSDRTARLRPPPARIVSRLRLVAEIESLLPTEMRHGGSPCRGRVDGLSHVQMSYALSAGGPYLDRLAAHHGFQRVDEETFVQRRRAA